MLVLVAVGSAPVAICDGLLMLPLWCLVFVFVFAVAPDGCFVCKSVARLCVLLRCSRAPKTKKKRMKRACIYMGPGEEVQMCIVLSVSRQCFVLVSLLFLFFVCMCVVIGVRCPF